MSQMDSELSEDFVVKVGMHQESVLSLFLFTIVVDVDELAREGVLSKIVYADDVVLMNDTNYGLRDKF